VLSFLSSAQDMLTSFMGYVLPFLFVLLLVIFVHEMGHFLVGRWCGVRVETFSLGFGPRLLSFRDKNETEWALCAIPLGGYVKFKGDLNAASIPDADALASTPPSEQGDSFPHKAIWQRAAIVAAGPLANFILAFVIFTLSFSFVGRQVVEPIIAKVSPNSVAEEVGFKPGDRVLEINDQPVVTFDEVFRNIAVSEGQLLRFKIERTGQTISLEAMARIMATKTVMGTDRRPVMGFIGSGNPDHMFTRHYSVPDASAEGLREIAFMIDRTAHYISGLFSGRERADQLSGPTRIAYISGKVAETGIGPLLMLAGILSISIGLINLLPVPMLDGGHLLFYAIEAMFGRPVSPRAQEIGFRIGFAMVVSLMVFSTWNDITHLTGLAK
jgi:regulator of sigma E protease